MKVVGDNAIQSRWIFFLGCLEPLSFKFREKTLQLGKDLVSFHPCGQAGSLSMQSRAKIVATL